MNNTIDAILRGIFGYGTHTIQTILGKFDEEILEETIDEVVSDDMGLDMGTIWHLATRKALEGAFGIDYSKIDEYFEIDYNGVVGGVRLLEGVEVDEIEHWDWKVEKFEELSGGTIEW